MKPNIRKELLKGLTEEQIAMISEFDNASDLLQLAKDEGVELTEEQLNAITGGSCETIKVEEDK